MVTTASAKSPAKSGKKTAKSAASKPPTKNDTDNLEPVTKADTGPSSGSANDRPTDADGHRGDIGPKIAQGRAATSAVRAYLDHLAQPRRRIRTKAQVSERVEAITASLDDETDSLARLRLIQQRVDLQVELAGAPEVSDDATTAALETAFAAAADAYSDKHGVSYSAWREFGVPARVLAKTEMKRTRIPK